MPNIRIAGPYEVYFTSHDQGEPPHVHVDPEKMAAKIWLSPISVAYNLWLNFLLLAICATAPLYAASLQPGPLSRRHIDGAGCSMEVPGVHDQRMFEWDFSDEAWIHLGGSDLRFHLIDSKGMDLEEGRGEIGDRQFVTFSASKARLTITFTLRSKCAASDESCEAVRIDALIKGHVGKRSFAFRASGQCGT